MKFSLETNRFLYIHIHTKYRSTDYVYLQNCNVNLENARHLGVIVVGVEVT